MVTGQTLNQLTRKDPENHKRYLNRMQRSAQSSTKSLIPIYATPVQILDVGCSDGCLMEAILREHPNSIVSGLELNSTSAEICRKKGFTVYEKDICEFASSGRRFDCIIFSSVLHEISSYAVNEEERFKVLPIEKALQAAYKLLNPGGRLIIRDGLSFGSNELLKLNIHTPKVQVAFNRFLKETPIKDYHTGQVIDNYILAPGNCLKEFLFTYTWGEGSWHREVLEQYGILSCKDWINTVQNAGFIISKYSTSPEQYLDYLSKDFSDTPDLRRLMAENTILICAVK